ncbi:hypothetical protein [Nitrincola sp. MINF-07-Sa-05]|uniref:hypothetical protein n=1 Tax=Nitrincola salilacus TaxID=3400273 RepID=UPI003917B910
MKTIMRKALVPMVVASGMLSLSAYSENRHSLYYDGGIEAVLAAKDNFYIEIEDQVTGGCLPQPLRLKDQFELSLRQNNFKIAKEDRSFKTDVFVVAQGYAIGSDHCVVDLYAELRFPLTVLVDNANHPDSFTTVFFQYPITKALLFGSKSTMQNRLEIQMRSIGDELYLRLSRAKDDFGSKFPEILQRQLEASQ